VIDACESTVRQLVPVMAERGLRREHCCDREKGLHVGNSSRGSLMKRFRSIVER
jgi:hypothetical protein